MAERGGAKREWQLMDVTKQIEGHTICAFGDGALACRGAAPLQHEIERRIDQYSAIRIRAGAPWRGVMTMKHGL